MAARRTHLVGAAALSLLAIACGAAEPDGAATPEATTTTVPVPITHGQPSDPGPPGGLLAAEPLDGVPAGGQGWRVLYASQTASGAPVAVSGQVVVPAGDPPSGGWPVIGWGHPTTGTSDRCTPSVQGPSAIHNIDELLAAGIAVAATDFEGIGTEGGHPYLVGAAEGQNVLDAVRAASRIEGSGVTDRSPVVLAGFSQGGHAVLWAAQRAPEYAPELDIRGVQAVSPVTDVPAFAERAEGMDEQFGVLVTIVYGMQQAHPDLDLAEVLTPEALDLLPSLEDQCIGDVVITYTRPVGGLLRASPRSLPGWQERLTENTAGQVALDLPVHVVQGADDPIVHERVTAELVHRLCAAGDPVSYDVIEGADHAVLTPERSLPWIEDRLAGDPPPNTC
jgi:acetyl esterase/lipase